MVKSKNRVKGNTRPSNSGHSAELLVSTGLQPVFVGFHAFQGGANLMMSNPEDQKCAREDEECAPILRKLLKRDATTKLKAVVELMEYCQDSSHDLMCLLPGWPRCFNRLALDPNNRVREIIHKVNGLLISKVRRECGPYLKRFMGIWLITQCDSHAPAAANARMAFSSVFQKHKQEEALLHCKTEVLEVIKAGLFETDKDSCSLDSKGVIIHSGNDLLFTTCCISGLKQFISYLSKDNRQKIQGEITTIVSNPLFWSLARHCPSEIRAQWFLMVSSLCANMPSVFENLKLQLVCCIMGCLSDDASCASVNAWDCALHVINSFPDCWTHIDFRRCVFPVILQFLKQGREINFQVYPFLLPFISSLPEDVFIKDLQMIEKFFTCLRESIVSTQFYKTRKERVTLLKTFLECMLCVVERADVRRNHDVNIIRHLACNQLMPLMKMSLKLSESNFSSHLYTFLGSILLKLEVQASDKQTEFNQYGLFLSAFWDFMNMLIKRVLEKPHTEHDDRGVIISLRSFFSCLHSRLEDTKPKLLKILSPEREWNTEDTITSFDLDSFTDPSASSESCPFLNEYTFKTCQHLFKILNAEVHPCCLEFLSELIMAVNSSQIYLELLRELNIPVEETAAAPEQFFKDFILPRSDIFNSDSQLRDIMLNIVFCICSCLETEKALKVLDSCSKVGETSVLFCHLTRTALSDSKGNDALFHKWFQTHAFSQFLLGVTSRMIEKLADLEIGDSDEVNLAARSLIHCISEACSSEGRIPVAEGYRIMELLAASVSNPRYIYCAHLNCKFYDFFHFISGFCHCLYELPVEQHIVVILEDILVQLFMISVNMDKHRLPDERAEQIKNDWKSGLLWCAHNDAHNSFITRAADCIHNLLQKPMQTERHSYIRELASEFLLQVELAYKDIVVDPYGSMYVYISEKVFPDRREWEKLKGRLQLDFVPSVLQGNTFYPALCEYSVASCPESVPPVIVTASAVAFLFSKLLVSNDMQNISTPSEISGGPLTRLFLQNVPHLLWALCYVKSKGYLRNEFVKCNPSPYELETFFNAPMPYLKNHEDYKCVLHSMFELSLHSDARKWALPLAALLKQAAGSRVLAECLPGMVDQMQGCYGIYDTLTMQVCCQLLPQNEKVRVFKEIPDDFFKEAKSHFGEQKYFSIWSQMNSCLTESSTFNSSIVSEKLLVFLEGLTKTKRDVSETGVLFSTNFFGTFHIILRDHADMLKENMWKYVFDVISSWFQHCINIGSTAVNNASSMILVSHTCTLISIISHLFGEKTQYEEIDECCVKTAYKAWHDLFDKTFSADLLKLFLEIAEVVHSLPQLSESVECLMYSLSQSIDFICGRQMIVTLLPDPLPVCEDPVKDRKVVYDMLGPIIAFLCSKSRPLQLGTHIILKKIMPFLPELCEPGKIDTGDSEGNVKCYFHMFPLVPLIKKWRKVTAEIVNDVLLGSSCIVEPYTPAFRMTSAYLFAWLEVLEYFKGLPVEDKSMFGSGMEDSKLLSVLLENLIRLLPESPGLCSGHIKPMSIIRRHRQQFIYVEPPPASSYDQLSSNHLQHWACFVYFTVLQTVPTLVRRWFKNLDKKVAEYVENFTTRTVSGSLSMMEINAVTASNTVFKNMSICTRPQLQQVLAQYQLDDTSTELKITVPKNYPLDPIVAEIERTMGVSQAQLRYWLLQLNTALNYQNSSITDALAHWKRNLDRRFDGIEGCMICFCVFDSSTLKVPKKTCSTCKKKFHDTCLFRWFSTSNNSLCPLCRNYFYKRR